MIRKRRKWADAFGLHGLILHSIVRIPDSSRRGISLVEILISVFVLLFGLMGVASIFPVGNHYMTEGEKFDMGSALAENAFEEMGSRGLLRPENWLYANHVGDPLNPSSYTPGTEVTNANGLFTRLQLDPPQHPGHAFVIDPMGSDELPNLSASRINERLFFPWNANALTNGNPWPNNASPPIGIAGSTWPIFRMTLPAPDPSGTHLYVNLPLTVSETIFRLRDELVVEFPDDGDRPGVQTLDIDRKGTALLTDDVLLRRQYQGNYSWLATVVPQTLQAIEALQPADPNQAYGNYRYDVSVVVFRKRETEPSEKSERLMNAELISQGNLIIYSVDNNMDAAKQQVDSAVEGVRPSSWIALAGVNQTTGTFLLKWYRLLSLDQESESINIPSLGINKKGRLAMLDGPDWPANSATELRAILLPGAFGVATQELTMEGGSLRSYE